MSTSWQAPATERFHWLTSNLARRAREHRTGVVDGFTKKYGCKLLVWYETHESIEATRNRERQMKKWNRLWKLGEIEKMNPDWNDLFESIV